MFHPAQTDSESQSVLSRSRSQPVVQSQSVSVGLGQSVQPQSVSADLSPTPDGLPRRPQKPAPQAVPQQCPPPRCPPPSQRRPARPSTAPNSVSGVPVRHIRLCGVRLAAAAGRRPGGGRWQLMALWHRRRPVRFVPAGDASSACSGGAPDRALQAVHVSRRRGIWWMVTAGHRPGVRWVGRRGRLAVGGG